MPHWLIRQLRHAFYKKDKRQLLILNDCWFTYCHKQLKQNHSKAEVAEQNKSN